jgi:hypothetical protein
MSRISLIGRIALSLLLFTAVVALLAPSVAGAGVTYVQQAELTTSGTSQLGDPVAISADGSTVLAGGIGGSTIFV